MVPTRVAIGMLRLGSFEQRSFLCMAGAGLDAEIVCHVNLDLKAALGKLAYYIGGFSQVLRPLDVSSKSRWMGAVTRRVSR